MSLHTKLLSVAVVAAVCTVVIPSIVLAQSAEESTETKPADETVWTRDELTGEWGGLRTDLSKHGIDLTFRLSQYGQSVTNGGVNENGELGGTMDYRVNLDGPKLFGSWEGFSINMHARTRWGKDINADAGNLVLQNAGMLSQLPGDYNGTDVTGLIATQYLPVFGGVGALVVGKHDVIDTVTGFFPHLGYGQEGFMNTSSLVSAVPWFGAVAGLSLYGAIGMAVNQEYGMPQTGVMAFGTENVSTNWGSVSDSFDDGAFLAGFHRFFWKMDEKTGYFMVFAGGSTKEQASNDPSDWVHIPGQGIETTKEKKPWAVAAYVYQEFWHAPGNADRKAYFFTGGTAGPDNPAFAQYNFFANLEVFGPLASRPKDRLGVGGWWNGLSDNFVDLVSPVTELRDLYGFEVYYNYEVTPWMHVSADFQLVENELKGDDMAVIPGVRLVIDF